MWTTEPHTIFNNIQYMKYFDCGKPVQKVQTHENLQYMHSSLIDNMWKKVNLDLIKVLQCTWKSFLWNLGSLRKRFLSSAEPVHSETRYNLKGQLSVLGGRKGGRFNKIFGSKFDCKTSLDLEFNKENMIKPLQFLHYLIMSSNNGLHLKMWFLKKNTILIWHGATLQKTVWSFSLLIKCMAQIVPLNRFIAV